MFFSGKNKSSTDKKGRASIIGTLFNPHIGASIKPIGESGAVFVRLMATIFALNGLFPKNHPALQGDDTQKLSFAEVMNTAWSGLTFTREGLPKTILFFTVAGAMVLTALSVITALLLGLVGSAHAATGNIFTVSNPSSDLAINWIDYLFNPTNSASAASNIASSGHTTLPTTTIQKALIAMLGFYSNAMLIVAAVLLFYHLASMTVETAHHGVVMGKNANQIWAPIRLVVAVGLLVPISTGLNSGQFIVLKMAQWGSALASNAWGYFVTELANESPNVPVPISGDASATGSNLTMMYACEYAYNYHVSEVTNHFAGVPSLATNANINGWGWTGGPPDTTNIAGAVATDGSTKYSFTNKVASDYDLCGSYTRPKAPNYSNDPVLQNIAMSVYNGYWAAFQAANVDAAKLSTNISFEIPTLNASGPIPDMAGAIAANDSAYQSALQNTLNGALSSSLLAAAIQKMAADSTNQGWISAGAWFNKLSSMQAALGDIAASSIPQTSPPKIGKDATQIETHWYQGNSDIKKASSIYNATIINLNDFANMTSIGLSTPSQTGTGTTGTGKVASLQGHDCTLTKPTECIFLVASLVASAQGVWSDTDMGNGQNLGLKFSGKNPLAELASFGHKLVGAGMNLFDIALGLYIAQAIGVVGQGVAWVAGFFSAPVSGGTSLVASGIITVFSQAASIIGGALFFLGFLFLTAGLSVAYIIPLLPFMHFFFNTITWVASIAEGVIAVPLIALAHITPAGEGLPGPSAKASYYYVFSIMLRPIMMVFGLICALLIMYVAVGLMNALYATAISSSSDMTTGHTMMSRIMYTLLYVVLLYSIANHAFALISRFPNTCIEWMGGKGLHGQEMGNPGHIGSATSVAGTYLGEKMAHQVQGIGSNVANALKGLQGTQGKRAGELGQRGEELTNLQRVAGGSDAQRQNEAGRLAYFSKAEGVASRLSEAHGTAYSVQDIIQQSRTQGSTAQQLMQEQYGKNYNPDTFLDGFNKIKNL